MGFQLGSEAQTKALRGGGAAVAVGFWSTRHVGTTQTTCHTHRPHALALCITPLPPLFPRCFPHTPPLDLSSCSLFLSPQQRSPHKALVI